MLKLDSRQITQGDIFIAIKGKRTDGNNYIQDAINAGAKLVVTERNFDNPCVLTVPNTAKALTRLGRYFRSRANLCKVISITGSCGKTTIRNWLYTVLQKNTVQSLHNYNTMLSMPLNFEQIQYGTKIGIFEIGTNSKGEILPLAKYIKPNIGIITNIYESHIGMFNDINELANEKMSIIDGIRPYGTLLYDGNCVFKNEIIKKCIDKHIVPISVGYNAQCNYSINYIDNQILLKTRGKVYKYSLKVVGKHYAYMSAVVIAILDSMGFKIPDYINAVQSLEPLEGRGCIREYTYHGKKFKVINDSYNASPSAMRASLDSLSQYRANKVIVIGEMGELGKDSGMYHSEISKKLSNFNKSKIYFVGSKRLWETMKRHVDIECFESLNDNIMQHILNTTQNGDIVFLKGSRNIGLDKVISYIKCSTT